MKYLFQERARSCETLHYGATDSAGEHWPRARVRPSRLLHEGNVCTLFKQARELIQHDPQSLVVQRLRAWVKTTGPTV